MFFKKIFGFAVLALLVLATFAHALEFNPSEIDFGTVTDETESITRSITVVNPSTEEVVVASSVGVGPPETDTNNLLQCADIEASLDCGPIPPSGFCSLTVTLKPYKTCPFTNEEAEAVLYVYASDRQTAAGWDPYVIPVRAVFNLPVPSVEIVGDAVIDLGEVQVGETAQGQVTLKNNGSGTLMANTYIDGQELFQNGEVEIDNSCIYNLAPGSVCTVTVYYTPFRGAGDLSGRLVIVTNVPDTPMIEVPITVRAVGDPMVPRMVLEKDLIDFGVIEYPGEKSDIVVLHNEGTAELSISDNFTVVGDDCFENTEITALCDPAHIAPGEYCYIQVKTYFTEGSGECEASFAIFSNDPDNSVKQIRLKAQLELERVTSDDIQIYPAGGEPTDWFEFENLTLDDEKEQIFYLRNASQVDITVTGLYIENDATGNFDVSFDTCTGNTVPAGGICVFGVKVHPRVEGSIFSRVTIEYLPENGEPEETQLMLSAVVQRVEFDAYLKKPDGTRLSDNKYVFETVGLAPTADNETVSSGNETIYVVIENDGEADVSFISVFEYDEAFRVNVDGCPQIQEDGTLPLGSGETCVIEVTYAPNEPGVHVAIFAVFRGTEIFPFALVGMAEESTTVSGGSTIVDDTSGSVLAFDAYGTLSLNVPAIEGWTDADIFLVVVRGEEWWGVESDGDVKESNKYVMFYFKKDVNLENGYRTAVVLDGLEDVCKPGDTCEIWAVVAKSVNRPIPSEILRGDYVVWKTQVTVPEQVEENPEDVLQEPTP